MIFLYLIILNTAANYDFIRRFEFKDYESCNKSLSAMVRDNKKESTVIAFCANEKNQRHYGSTWWNDKVGDPK